eukprot:SM000321S12210  [mRNA]  locus=s321:93330:96812:- [translate_table: standard]
MDVWTGLDDYPKFNQSDPITERFARMVEDNIVPWTKVPGIDALMGSTGMVHKETLHRMGAYPQFMSCCGHVRIVDGKVYFRYGGFISVWYRLRRFNQSIKMLQDAVDWYGLTDLRAEFFLNTCDLPISYDSAQSPGRSGFPVFSTQFAPGSTDLIVPDPLDLSEGYMPSIENEVPWEEKVGKAIFRGASTNYDHKDWNWRANPRFRLHRMTDVQPELMDAKVMRWSHALQATIREMKADGLELGSFLQQKDKNTFKYEIVVDGGVGTCRTCGVLASNQVVIRQESAYSQFFEPLLVPGIHYIPTRHHFQDLPAKIEYARNHDKEMQQIVKNANEASKWGCTWEGRTLYWAIVLVKWQKNAMEEPQAVEAPAELCDGPAVSKPIDQVPNNTPKCGTAEADSSDQPKCTFFCINGRIDEEKWFWLSSEVFSDLPRLGPMLTSTM